MIKQTTIDELRSRIDIHDIIGQYIKLKKTGSGHTGLCPFHNEKTPSFHVSASRQIYKCFGCGRSGDAISFIMEHDRKTFVEAIEQLCSQYNITPEYDQKAQQESEEKKNTRAQMLQLVSLAHQKYEQLLQDLPDDAPVITYMASRGYDRQRLRSWSLGFAPDQWKFLTETFISMGHHATAVSCGLISSREGKTWDFHRNRLIIPIHDHNGILVGLASRNIPASPLEGQVPVTPPEGGDGGGAKYLNPCESPIYHKSRIWYGLWQAQKAIRDRGFAYITEGYLDVQSMHDAGIENTIASCGTAIDDHHARLLKRYTQHVVICYDADIPGQTNMMKQVNLFLAHDFKVSIAELPEGKDPDEFIREVNNQLINKTEAA